MPIKLRCTVEFKAQNGYCFDVNAALIDKKKQQELNDLFKEKDDIFVSPSIPAKQIRSIKFTLSDEDSQRLAKRIVGDKMIVTVPKNHFNKYKTYVLSPSGNDEYQVLHDVDRKRVMQDWFKDGEPEQWGMGKEKLRVI